MSRNVSVILAGGSGTRVGLAYPKQFAKVAGRTVLEHTMNVFQRHAGTDEIVVVSNPAYVDDVLDLAKKNGWSKISRVIAGGEDRFGSTHSALVALADLGDDAKVLFHDAVRPFVTGSILDACFDALERYAAIDVAIPTADTIVRVRQDGTLVEIPPRVEYKRGQTPQGFRLGRIRRAYELALAAGRRDFTCDCGVFIAMLPDEPIAVVDGASTNMKITHAEDLFLADKLFQSRGDSRAIASGDAAPALAGQVVVIFGGSYGIGASIAEEAERLGATVRSFSRSATGTNVASVEQVRHALETTHRDLGRIDHVVNSAAILLHKAFDLTTEDEISEALDVNLRGAVNVARAARRYLAESRGSLLFFTSSSYTRGRAFYSLYSATKSAVVNFSQAIAEEWTDDGIRVNCINPERTKTPMRTKNFGLEPDDTLLAPERVANVSVRVLASNVTGHVIDVKRPSAIPNGWGFAADE